eukprot:2296955-Prymnesium_polylepis.2
MPLDTSTLVPGAAPAREIRQTEGPTPLGTATEGRRPKARARTAAMSARPSLEQGEARASPFPSNSDDAHLCMALRLATARASPWLHPVWPSRVS